MTALSPECIAPGSVADIVEAVRSAADAGERVSAARHPGTARRIDLSTMNQVVDYPARDMTITVEAGMTVRTLSETLRNENQQLPVDCPDSDMTVGAFVASNCAASRQYGYGTLRDYLIGMEAVDGQGRVFHAGGRVVKNVAGYDLCRLMIGSFGRLGILTQLTFKLKPRTEHTAIARFAWKKPEHVTTALDALNTSVTRPILLDLSAAPDELWVVATGFAGTEASCEWELARIRGELNSCDKMHVLIQGQDDVHEYCAHAAAHHLPESGQLMIRTLPSRVVDVSGLLIEHGSHVMAHAGNGIILATLPEPSSADTLTEAVTRNVSDCGGAITHLGELPAQLSPQEQQIIRTFDPQQVFAPAAAG